MGSYVAFHTSGSGVLCVFERIRTVGLIYQQSSS
nr:MAG TPA: hypothetical protein [Caudoviricetes sp.]